MRVRIVAAVESFSTEAGIRRMSARRAYTVRPVETSTAKAPEELPAADIPRARTVRTFAADAGADAGTEAGAAAGAAAGARSARMIGAVVRRTVVLNTRAA